MIIYKQGNLLDSDAEALVNPVNTVGVMGKGLALMFKQRFNENYLRYRTACTQKLLLPGCVFVTATNDFIGPKWIVNFATKDHWKDSSKIEWIESGLLALLAFIHTENVKSIAVPRLGAGNGGLEWREVKLLIIAALGSLPDTDVIIYEPTTIHSKELETDNSNQIFNG